MHSTAIAISQMYHLNASDQRERYTDTSHIAHLYHTHKYVI